MTVVILDQKFFQNSCSRQFRIANAVVTLIASRSDRLTEIYFSPNQSYSFWDDDDNCDDSDKTKVLDEVIFRGVVLDCFTAKLDEYTDSKSM